MNKSNIRLQLILSVNKPFRDANFRALKIKLEDRRRFGNKNEQIHFVLRSTCTIFDEETRR